MRVILRRLTISIFLIAFAIVVALTVYFRGSLAQVSGEHSLSKLAGPVQIERDFYGIATITASNRADIATALGFVHGQERFFQMDLSRRAAAGELSVLFGARAVNYDQNVRLHRLRSRAQEIVHGLGKIDALLLDSYAHGVNAGLAALSARPFEYTLLQTKPQAWLPEDSLLVAYAMFLDLTDENAERDLHLGAMNNALPEALMNFLVPTGTSWDAPLIGEVAAEVPIPDASVFSLHDQQISNQFTGPKFLREAQIGLSDEYAVGSNNWAVSSALSESGGALLAGDMHLGIRIPNTWFRARWKMDGAEPLDISGVTLPGLPLMIAGSNGKIAWTFTNSYGDFSDRIVLSESDDIIQHQEIIDIKNADSTTLVVDESKFGPVVTTSTGARHALRWLGHDTQALNLNLAWLERAHTVDEALSVAKQSGTPPQNFVVADHTGEIAWTIIGHLPERPFAHAIPVSASTAGQWSKKLPPVNYPQLRAPQNGAIWTANARLVGGDDLAVLGDGGYALGARQKQIRDELINPKFTGPKFSEKDFLALQRDDRALFLSRWRDLILSLPAQSDTNAARLMVANWSARADKNDAGYALVKFFRDEVHRRVLQPFVSLIVQTEPEFSFTWLRQAEAPVWTLVTAKPSHLLNPIFSDWEALLDDAWKNAIVNASRGHAEVQPWGEFNRLKIEHPLASALPPFIARFLKVPELKMSGDTNMPFVQAPAFGASQRFVVSPGREENGLFHMPAGQSGHPLSPYFKRGHQDWVEGTPTPFLPGETEHHLTLTPSN